MPGSLEEMAGIYVAAMVEAYPAGPYHLAGWSFGGALAFEIAQQLTAAGREVGAVALIDAAAPSVTPAEETHILLSRNYAKDDSAVLDDLSRAFKDAGWDLGIDETKTERQFSWQFLISSAQAHGFVPDGYTVDEMKRKVSVYINCGAIFNKYRPQPQHLNAIYYLAWKETDQKDLNWIPLISNKFEVVGLECNHLEIGYEPFIGHIGRHLRKQIRKAPLGPDKLTRSLGPLLPVREQLCGQ